MSLQWRLLISIMKWIFTCYTLFALVFAHGQEIPSPSQNTASLVTFGPVAGDSWGDEDKTQVYIAEVPANHQGAFYVRIWDADTSGENDQKVKGQFNSTFTFSVYAISDSEAVTANDPNGEDESGKLLASKTYGAESSIDQDWVTLGPFFPQQGGLNSEGSHHIFKILCRGTSGDDGNIYKYFVSSEQNSNSPLQSALLYTYESTVRLHSKARVAHFYPFIDESMTALKQYNFDMDNEVDIKVYSKSKMGHQGKSSADAEWAVESIEVLTPERLNCYDMRYENKTLSSDNDITVYYQNQYNESVKQMNSPIGDIRFKYSFSVEKRTP